MLVAFLVGVDKSIGDVKLARDKGDKRGRCPSSDASIERVVSRVLLFRLLGSRNCPDTVDEDEHDKQYNYSIHAQENS